MIDFTLKDKAGAKVLRLQIVRKHVEERVREDKCSHLEVQIDPMLTTVQCITCGQLINPVEWLCTLTEYWSCIDDIHAKLIAQRQALATMSAAFELQRRAKCQHCKKITRVRLPSNSEATRRLNAAASNHPPTGE